MKGHDVDIEWLDHIQASAPWELYGHLIIIKALQSQLDIQHVRAVVKPGTMEMEMEMEMQVCNGSSLVPRPPPAFFEFMKWG